MSDIGNADVLTVDSIIDQSQPVIDGDKKIYNYIQCPDAKNAERCSLIINHIKYIRCVMI